MLIVINIILLYIIFIHVIIIHREINLNLLLGLFHQFLIPRLQLLLQPHSLMEQLHQIVLYIKVMILVLNVYSQHILKLLDC